MNLHKQLDFFSRIIKEDVVKDGIAFIKRKINEFDSSKQWFQFKIPYTDPDYILCVMYYVKSRTGVTEFDVTLIESGSFEILIDQDQLDSIKKSSLFTGYDSGMRDREMLTSRVYRRLV
jgi:hypothetical protein